MVGFTFKSAIAMALMLPAGVNARLSYPDSFLDAGGRQLGSGNCHDCDCFTCDSVSEKNDGTLDVKIGHCKAGSISWMCCVGTDGHQGNCNLASCSGSQEGAKCNGISEGEGLMINIAKEVVDFTINTHDGQTEGDADMQNAVCGGNGNQGGGCAEGGATAHCLKTFNLFSDCGYNSVVDHSEGEQETPEPAPLDAPTCATDVEPCWDGSFVSREGPDCKFTACPENPNEKEPAENKHTDIAHENKPAPTCNGYHTCDCFTCGDVTEKDDGTLDIKIDHCKNGDISWICCSALDGVPGKCDVTTCGGDAKCNGMATGEFTINIPQDTKTFQINTHDGKTAGNAAMFNAVCGGNGNQGGSCVDEHYTAHCLIDMSVKNDCGYTFPGYVGVDAPEPEPASGSPTDAPTESTDSPTDAPTDGPTSTPTPAPTDSPTVSPTPAPTDSPTVCPTLQPTVVSGHPSASPTTGAPTSSPTKAPTDAPTSGPTITPTGSPGGGTDAPTGSPRTPPPVTKPPKTEAPISTPPGSFGDPHVKVWSGETFDFHGSCDLVLLDNPTFHDGLGMSIHIRTKIVTWWSFIETAVVRIGNETIEVSGGKQHKYYVNGVKGDSESKNFLFSELGFKVLVKQATGHQIKIRIDLLHADAIGVETFKEFVRVNIRNTDPKWKNFEGSRGLMGVYPTGTRLGRDGKTVFTDMNAFGQEWQVRDTEPMLFQTVDGPQYPTKCLMPHEATVEQKRRRLGAGKITREAADAACAGVIGLDHDSCVFDVLATQDLDMAGSY